MASSYIIVGAAHVTYSFIVSVEQMLPAMRQIPDVKLINLFIYSGRRMS